MLDSVVRRLATQKASLEPQKAVTGPGAAVMSWGIPISSASNSPQQIMRDAQAVYARGNRWVKRAEMTISGRVGSVPWHLETPDGETINDDSAPELRQVRDLLEKPLGTPEYARQYPSQPASRRVHWGLTSRHAGLCNVAFWMLDELNGLTQFPTRIFLIRPDRMTPREQGGRLVGWTIDEQQGGGTDLSVEEVLPFYLDQPDKGYFGTGLVESIMSTLNLPSTVDRHAIDTLGSGGRLPGIYSPKEREGDDVFDRLVSDLRTIKDMPDSSKRDVVARAPIEFHATSADMTRLNVIELSRMSRDDVLTHWGVPYSTIGGATPMGLNGGEARKFDEAALWQNAVQFRVDMLYETIQYGLLDRLKAINIELELVIESPTFDDDLPKFQLAEKAQYMPLRNFERRALIGYDPFGDPALDNAVWMPINIVELATAPEETMTGKASLDKALLNVRTVSVSRIEKDISAVLKAMRSEVVRRISAKPVEHFKSKPSDLFWWHEDKWHAELEKVLRPHLSLAAETVGQKVQAQLGKTGKADVLGSDVLTRLLKSVGERITGILGTTRDEVKRLIQQGLDEGLDAAEIGDLIENATTFDEYRAELIARTETAHVLNEAALESYRDYGVGTVRAIDGDDDEECAARDGQEFDLDEALSIEDHPNGTLDWEPVL